MRLIEDLLDVARLKSGKFTLKFEPLRLDTLLEETVETAQLLANGQQIELTIDNGPTTAAAAAAGPGPGSADQEVGDLRGSLVVKGDAARLEQAVLNLIMNAITHAPGSARIEVRLCFVDGPIGASWNGTLADGTLAWAYRALVESEKDRMCACSKASGLW
jgi:two-component system, chemotaxis family, CheB/CheR fusion protein